MSNTEYRHYYDAAHDGYWVREMCRPRSARYVISNMLLGKHNKLFERRRVFVGMDVIESLHIVSFDILHEYVKNNLFS